MAVVFLIYSNSREEPLPTLREEDEEVYSILSRRTGKGHFAIHRDAYASIPSIIEYLELYREEVALFAFSGHAGRDQLLLEDESANSTGVAKLLARCPKLRLVVLNGCSTAAQVERLLELPTKPVVIATKAPVGDRAATAFAISFFRSMGEQHSNIADAFEAGLSAAQTLSNRTINETRQLALRNRTSPAVEEGWGIYASEPTQLQWALPVEMEKEQQRKQTVAWLKYWLLYQAGGIVLILLTLLLQLPADSMLVHLVPVYFFFAPVPATLRTNLPVRRLYELLALHALIYFPLLYVWMSGMPLAFGAVVILGLSAYFFILPMIQRKGT